MEICLIDAEGLDEEIRCEMCRNPMRSNTGCDGGCTYDEKLYEKIVRLLNERIKPLPSIKPELKIGRWLQISPARIYECSECAQMVMTKDISCYKFCHGCGAYMGGDTDEVD